MLATGSATAGSGRRASATPSTDDVPGVVPAPRCIPAQAGPNAAGSIQIVRAATARQYAHEASGEGASSQSPVAGHLIPCTRPGADQAARQGIGPGPVIPAAIRQGGSPSLQGAPGALAHFPDRSIPATAGDLAPDQSTGCVTVVSSANFPAAGSLQDRATAAGAFWRRINDGTDRLRRGEDALLWNFRAGGWSFAEIAIIILQRRARISAAMRERGIAGASKRHRAAYLRWRDELRQERQA